MASIREKIDEIYSLEQLSSGDTILHTLHPLVKIITTLVYIIGIVSFKPYEFSRLVPFVFYPILMMAIGEIPYAIILKRVWIALPFALLGGISNLFFNKEIAFSIYSVTISFGVISFFVILLRTVLAVSAVLLLVALTPFSVLTGELRRMKVPEILISLLEMTYRYIGVLLEEVASMYTAYQLRGNRLRGVQMQHMGSFVGQLLLRTFDRADRVYQAMKCRGYGLTDSYSNKLPFTWKDFVFLGITVGGVVVFCITDVPALWMEVFR